MKKWQKQSSDFQKMTKMVPGENFMKKSQPKSSNKPKMTRLVLRMKFSKSDKIGPSSLEIGKISPSGILFWTFIIKTLGKSKLGKNSPWLKFGRLADLVPRKSEKYTLGPWA